MEMILLLLLLGIAANFGFMAAIMTIIILCVIGAIIGEF